MQLEPSAKLSLPRRHNMFAASVFVALLLLIATQATGASDYCRSHGSFDTETSLCNGKKGPLVDARIKDGGDTRRQCRVFCSKWEDPDIQAEQRPSDCEICETNLVDSDVSDVWSNKIGDICVASSKCIDQCGDPDDGCVYTGSCQTFTCFVKKEDPSVPALISMKGDESETGEGIHVSVENVNNIDNTAAGGSSGGASVTVGENSSGDKNESEAESNSNTGKIIGGASGAVFAVIAAVAVGLIVHKLELCSRGKKGHEDTEHAPSSPA